MSFVLRFFQCFCPLQRKRERGDRANVGIYRIQDRKKFIASSLGMMSEDEKKLQRIEDIKELLS